jgi:hypothetical protein
MGGLLPSFLFRGAPRISAIDPERGFHGEAAGWSLQFDPSETLVFVAYFVTEADLASIDLSIKAATSSPNANTGKLLTAESRNLPCGDQEYHPKLATLR